MNINNLIRKSYPFIVMIIAVSCMDPIVEPDEYYSDYSEEILNDPEMGFPNGNFSDGLESWGGFTNQFGNLSIDTNQTASNSEAQDNNSVVVTSRRGGNGVYNFFSYEPGDTLLYTFYYMIPNTIDPLTNGDLAFELSVRKAPMDESNNWSEWEDIIYTLNSEDINTRLIADGTWRPITAKASYSSSDITGQYFRVGLFEWSFWSAGYEEERKVSIFLDNFTVSKISNQNNPPSDFSILYPSDGSQFNLDTITNFQTIPFAWESSTDEDTVIYTNRLTSEINCESADIASGFENYEEVYILNGNNEPKTIKMPRGYSNNFFIGTGNWLQFQTDWMNEFTVWLSDTVSRSGGHSLRMGSSNLTNPSHHTTLNLRLSEVSDNISKDRIVPGSEVTISGYMMTPSSDPLTGENSAAIIICSRERTWQYATSQTITSGHEPDVWHYVEVKMTIPERSDRPNTTTSLLHFRYNQYSENKGTVYFDDVKISVSKPLTYVVTDYYDVTTSVTNTMMSSNYLKNLFAFIRDDLSGISFSEADFKWGILATDNIQETIAINSPITFKIIDESTNTTSGKINSLHEMSEMDFIYRKSYEGMIGY